MISKRTLERWERERRQKSSARASLRSAVYMGKIEKEPCIFCETTEKVEAHHDDYSRPLSVVWVCKKHHVVLDREYEKRQAQKRYGILD